jgi:hypothetical protein
VRPAVSTRSPPLPYSRFVGIRSTHARVRKSDGWLPWSRLTVTLNVRCDTLPGQVAQLRAEAPFAIDRDVGAVHQMTACADGKAAAVLGPARHRAWKVETEGHVPVEKGPAHCLGRRLAVQEFRKGQPLRCRR